jgi:fatty-acyl-CoA synthase
VSVLNDIRGRLAAARVLTSRGIVDLRRPDEAVRAFMAIRRYGAFGGLLDHSAARYGDAPAITDERGTVSFRELDQASNALARGLAAKGIRPGSVIATLHRNSRDVMVTVSAANKVGVRTVLMNTGFAGPQLADVSARENVGCILVDDEFEDLLATLPSGTLRFTGSRLHELTDHQSTSSLPAPRQPGGMALLTSGTRHNRHSCWTGFRGRATAPITSPRHCSMRRVWPPALWAWSWAIAL